VKPPNEEAASGERAPEQDLASVVLQELRVKRAADHDAGQGRKRRTVREDEHPFPRDRNVLGDFAAPGFDEPDTGVELGF
jgi:hypothetical protein